MAGDSDDSDNKKILERLKKESKFDDYVARQILEQLPDGEEVDIDALVEQVKKNVNPRMIDTTNNWDKD